VENPTIHSCSVPRVPKKIGYGVGLFIVVLLAALASHYLFGLATGTRFNETQWAAAGAWFGGVMTFGAVAVALYQSNQAKERAERESRDSNQRNLNERLLHQEALARAEDRLATELDSGRRSEQTQTIAAVVAAIAEQPAVVRGLTTAVHLARRTPSEENYASRTAKYDIWQNSSGRLVAALQTALMVVDEPHVYEQVRRAGADCERLRRSMTDLYSLPFDEQIPRRQIHVNLNATLAHQGELIQVVRDYLRDSPKDSSIDPDQLMLW
jgi:hypothetical protein